MARIILLLGLIVSSCAIVLANGGQAAEVLELSSGRSVEIFALTHVESTQGPPGLRLKYRTTIPLDDIDSARVEANEIWNRFVVNVERANYHVAILSAFESAEGPINKGCNFVFVKEDGSWRGIENPEVAQRGLTDAFVRSFMKRIDHLYQAGLVNSLLLYLSDGWTMETKSQIENAGASIADRSAVGALGNAPPLAWIQDRAIREIRISDDRQSAVVESEQVQSVIVDGGLRTFIARTLDTLRLDDGYVVVAGTVNEIQNAEAP